MLRGRDEQNPGRALENQLRAAYEATYGWANPDQLLFVTETPQGERRLPSGPWQLRDCCEKRSEECLKTAASIEQSRIIVPMPVTWQDLELAHPKSYIDKVCGSRKELYDVYELDIETDGPPTQADVTNVIEPARRSVGGIVLATALAYVYGNAVYAGDCHHHCSTEVGEGSSMFCCVPIAWLLLRQKLMSLGIENPKALYIDVDVHHANGFAYARDELKIGDHFSMIDLFNESIWPIRDGSKVLDMDSIKFIDIAKPFRSRTKDKHYLDLLRQALAEAEDKLPKPDIIIYMAFNDVMDGDPLGKAKVTPHGIHERDRLVFQWATARNIPVMMIAGSGYSPNGCKDTRDILVKLNQEFGLWNRT